ncbi:hypothetical protein TI39_contig4247g00002 [Zymoseptoria brevis]|uniref:von Willebrand domain-containing protein n=1 Tax=Zymoseptoria brevis TaxID=1047168 RepID=A0A0F4G905_9PEZI|nr:hypothetical protein TI39_contig4247g00002 [Zymoseptoria brevis]
MFGGIRRTSDICGCYFVYKHQRNYLPQVEIQSHTTINPVSFITHLTQTFSNPQEDKLDQVRYTFPLYDGVAVCGYTIKYGDKTLKGIVKQKDDAKKTYQAAVDRGETAGLLQALPAGVFGVTLGNVPAKTGIIVDITYCGELKHDAAIDGLRFNLPTSIAPRYGFYPGTVLASNARNTGGIKITIDIDMGKSAIRRVQSPSHPIAVSTGELSVAAQRNKAPFNASQSSATLTQGTAELGEDFILQILVDDLNKPQAVLEVHPTLPNHRAIMATLIPQYSLPSGNPEIVFIADQSGSMSGAKNDSLVAALKVFLKSLPFGVRFNICAFGNSYKFLWPESEAYNEDNLNTAVSFVELLRADYGGTQMLEPVKEAFLRKRADLPMEVMLLTDGEIWEEKTLFRFLNEQIQEKKVDARVFALGIGNDVSHTLVEGVARAGRGFAQFVTQTEETDRKVMRMLKGALYAHTQDYSLEVHYEEKNTILEDDDFELVDKPRDGLVIRTAGSDDRASTTPASVAPISFFDTTTNIDDNPAPVPRYSHLPEIPTPKVLQAPTFIPPLFPANRSTVYLLLGPESRQRPVKSLTLKATSAAGPLQLDIPVHQLAAGKETELDSGIHVLAARKAIQDLEEGRGWLQSAAVSDSVLDTAETAGSTKIAMPVKDRYPSRFDEMVEREDVRLGVTYGVAAKHTSFVAVQADGEHEQDTNDQRRSEAQPAGSGGRRGFGGVSCMRSGGGNLCSGSIGLSPFGGAHAPGGSQEALFSSSLGSGRGGSSGGMFGAGHSNAAAAAAPGAGSVFSAASRVNTTREPSQAGLVGQPSPSTAGGLFAASSRRKKRVAAPAGNSFFADEEVPPVAPEKPLSLLHKLISLQTFSGAWAWSDELLALLKLSAPEEKILAQFGDVKDLAATALVVAFLQAQLTDDKEVWEMVVEKAKAWLGGKVGSEKVDETVAVAGGFT